MLHVALAFLVNIDAFFASELGRYLPQVNEFCQVPC